MKKIIIACAVILAGILSSCGNTNYCYEVTQTFTINGISSTIVEYTWATSNEIDAAIADIEKTLTEEFGLSEDAFEVTYKKVNASLSDCEILAEEAE